MGNVSEQLMDTAANNEKIPTLESEEYELYFKVLQHYEYRENEITDLVMMAKQMHVEKGL